MKKSTPPSWSEWIFRLMANNVIFLFSSSLSVGGSPTVSPSLFVERSTKREGEKRKPLRFNSLETVREMSYRLPWWGASPRFVPDWFITLVFRFQHLKKVPSVSARPRKEKK